MLWKRNYAKCFSLTGLINHHHLFREQTTLCFAQNEAHHQARYQTSPVPQIKVVDIITGSIFPSLRQRPMSLSNGPKLSKPWPAVFLLKQLVGLPHPGRHILILHRRLTQVAQFPPQLRCDHYLALAFTVLQNPWSPSSFQMTLQKTS